MASLKLLEVGQSEYNLRVLHIEEFLLKKGIKLEKKSIEKNLNWNELIPKYQSQFDWVLLSTDCMESCAAEYFKLPENVRRVGLADTIIKNKGGIWPKIYLIEVMKKFIYLKSPKLETRASALIIGDGALVRLSVYVLSTLGFSNLLFVSRDVEKVKILIEDLRKKYFGVNFSILDPNEITLEQPNSSCVVNTINSKVDSELTRDLNYFNFAKKNALVVDFNLVPFVTEFLIEANHLGMSTLRAIEIFGWMDALILEDFYQKKISTKEYFNSWLEFIKKS